MKQVMCVPGYSYFGIYVSIWLYRSVAELTNAFDSRTGVVREYAAPEI